MYYYRVEYRGKDKRPKEFQGSCTRLEPICASRLQPWNSLGFLSFPSLRCITARRLRRRRRLRLRLWLRLRLQLHGHLPSRSQNRSQLWRTTTTKLTRNEGLCFQSCPTAVALRRRHISCAAPWRRFSAGSNINVWKGAGIFQFKFFSSSLQDHFSGESGLLPGIRIIYCNQIDRRLIHLNQRNI